MPADKPSSLETILERAVQAKQPGVQVEARCPKCKRVHFVSYIKGMRMISVGRYRVMCESCTHIALGLGRRDGRDLPGQMYLPGLLDAK